MGRVAILVLLFLMSGTAFAQTGEVTYQGRLTDGSLPPTAQYDFIFRLYDGGPAPVGTPVVRDNVQVTNGIFTVVLDFGGSGIGVLLNGTALTLEIEVRPGASTGAYTTLSPRQPLTSAPYAIKSMNTGLLDGQPSSNYATTAALQAQNTALQAQITQLQADLAAATGGEHLWSKVLGSTSGDIGYDVAVDGSGNVFVAGHFAGTVNFGGGNLASAGSSDIFVAKYAGATGAHLWSKRYGSTGTDIARGLALDASGDVFVTGEFNNTVDFGGGFIRTSNGGADIYLLKLSGANGNTSWVSSYGAATQDGGQAVAVDNSGNPVITGYFNGTFNFGGGPLTSAGQDLFAAKFNGATGAHIWSKGFGSTAGDSGLGVATDTSGNVYVTGSHGGPSITFGGVTFNHAGGGDGFVVKLAAADGSHLWSDGFGSGGSDQGNGIAVDASGNAIVTGQFSATVDFGTGPLTSAGSTDIFLVKYNAGGVAQWSKAFGGTANDASYGIAVDSGGNPVITGFFVNTAAFGGALLHGASFGNGDIFVAKFTGAGGAYQWAKRFGGTGGELGYGVAIDSAGAVFVTGEFSSTTIDFGGGPLTLAGSGDVFLVKLK